MSEIQIGAEGLELQLQQAFSRIAAEGASEIRLLLDEAITPNHRLAELLRGVVVEAPSIRRVVLSHPSPGIRFVASSLSLLMPDVVFHAVTTPGEYRTTPATANAAAPETNTSLLVAHVDAANPAAAVEDAFGRAARRRSRVLILALDPNQGVDRRMVTLVSDALERVLSLEMLLVVHPSPSVGFLASGLGLRCPRVRVVPCANELEARELAGRRVT